MFAVSCKILYTPLLRGTRKPERMTRKISYLLEVVFKQTIPRQRIEIALACNPIGQPDNQEINMPPIMYYIERR